MNSSNTRIIALGKNNYDTWKLQVKCDRNTHRVNNNNKNYSNSGSHPKLRCNICGRLGHKASTCYSKNKNTQSSNHVPSNASWCLDSGCTSHMSNNKNIFNCLQFFNEGSRINLASSATTSIKGKGTVSFDVNNGSDTVSLANTMYVPDLRTNLMSVGTMTDRGFNVLFTKEEAKIIGPDGDVKFRAKKSNGLYYVEGTVPSVMTVTTTKFTDTEVWHRRFGHLNNVDLKSLAKRNLVLGFKPKRLQTVKPCEVCLKGKLTRSTFPKSSSRSSELLSIVHSDICGPMRVTSEGGHKYFITFTDDASRWCEVAFLKNKSEALQAFRNYKNMVENLTGKRIQHLQSDNGGEYCSTEFNRYLSECGIKRRLAVSYTPQQNGVAERKNRTLLDMARCMLLDSNLPESLWAEAIFMANHIRNRCPSASIGGEIPFTLWHEKKPCVACFRTFGTMGFTINRNQNRGKFDSRSEKCFLVSYSETSKAYRVWIPRTKTRDRNP